MLLPANTDFTDLDFDSVRARLIDLVQSVFPEWTDFDVANFGTILLELFAFVADILTHTQDAQARERFVATLTQRKSLIAIARTYGYTIPGPSAATALETFTLAAVPAADVTIPAGTEVRTPEISDPVRFQLLEDVVIPSGANPPRGTGNVEHSKTITATFAAAALGGRDAVLDRTPFLDGSASVSATNGAYTEVASFLDSGSTDRHFQVLVDQNDRATVRFGDGVRGAAPTGTIVVVYKVGGGRIGNVEAGRIRICEGSFQDEDGRSVRLSVTNAARASGGADRQTIEQARLALPESIRAGNRSVTREDFEINARRVPAIARALMTTRNEDPAVEENAGILYLVPVGGGAPTGPQLAAVETMVTETYPPTLTFEVVVLGAEYRTIDVWTRVTFAAGSSPASVKARIVAALEAYFAILNDDGTPNQRIDFGVNLPDRAIAWSDVFNAVRDVAGVRKIDPGDLQLEGLVDDVTLSVREFPTLGSVTVVNAATGETVL